MWFFGSVVPISENSLVAVGVAGWHELRHEVAAGGDVVPIVGSCRGGGRGMCQFRRRARDFRFQAIKWGGRRV